MITVPASDINAAINAGVVLACMASFGWRGYQRGLLRIVQRLISVLSGYVACYFFTGTLAGFLKTAFALNIFLSYMASAVLLLCGVAFIANYILLHFVAADKKDERADDEMEENETEVRAPAHTAGLVAGVLMGCFLGLITVWLAGITMDAVTLNTEGPGALVYRTVDPVRKMAGNMVGSAASYVVAQKTGQESLAPELTASLIADPVATSQKIADVSNSEAMKEFFSDPSAQLLMQENRIDELQRHEAFQKLMNTPQAKVFLDILGSSVKKTAGLTRESRAAHLLTDMYQKAQRIQTDPRFSALVDKPEFQQLLQNPSPATVMTSPLLKEMGDIIFSSSPSVVFPASDKPIREGSDQGFQTVEKPEWESVDTTQDLSSAATSTGESSPANEVNVIYRWTDAQGQKHFSQTRPDGDYPLEIIKSPQ